MGWRNYTYDQLEEYEKVMGVCTGVCAGVCVCVRKGVCAGGADVCAGVDMCGCVGFCLV